MTRISALFAVLFAVLATQSIAHADGFPGHVCGVTQHGPSSQYGPNGYLTVTYSMYACDSSPLHNLFVCGTGATGCGDGALFNDAQQARLSQILIDLMHSGELVVLLWSPNAVISSVYLSPGQHYAP